MVTVAPCVVAQRIQCLGSWRGPCNHWERLVHEINLQTLPTLLCCYFSFDWLMWVASSLKHDW